MTEKRNLYVIVLTVSVLILLAGIAVYRANDRSEVPRQSEGQSQTPVLVPLNTPTVTYTENGYAANFLSIKQGTAVTFKNESGRGMWTASARHPTHNEYPVLGGCGASAFDECREDPPGSSWQFVFDVRGVWKYHNHLHPQHTGTIIVE